MLEDTKEDTGAVSLRNAIIVDSRHMRSGSLARSATSHLCTLRPHTAIASPHSVPGKQRGTWIVWRGSGLNRRRSACCDTWQCGHVQCPARVDRTITDKPQKQVTMDLCDSIVPGLVEKLYY